MTSYYGELSKLTKSVMTDGMFRNSNSSNESNSDDEKCRLQTVDVIFSDNINRIRSNRKSFDELTCINNGIEHDSRSNGYNEESHLEKTGWLNVKHWLTVQCYEKVELTSKNQWKHFWIWLKDSNLQLFNDYLDINPKFTISTIDCFCYPLSEHRQYVFSLTTNTGDTYCFQSSNQFELDHWIRCIHSNSLLKQNKYFLKTNIKQLENDILYENKILNLAQLQLQLTTNNKTRLILSKQIELLEKNLEIFHMNLFRKQCYLSALDKNEYLPNSKDLLSQISPTTKTILYNLHAFTPAAFYACIISRQQRDRQKSKLSSSDSIENNQTILQTVLFDSNPQRKIIISINKTTTVGELLKRVTNKLNFEINDYFLYFNSTLFNGFIPNLNAKLITLTYSSVEICRKIIYQIILNNQLNLSGIEINRQYPSTIFVLYVNKGSEGERLGVLKGDEIIMINNFMLKDLDSTKFNRYLNQIPIKLTLRSSRLNQMIKNTNNEQQLNIKSLSNTQQIQKIIFELIQTEKSYVQDLQCLLKQYIEPLRNNSTVLPSDAIQSLSNSVKSIHQFQNTFLGNLQFNFFTQNIVISISETFIRFSKNFKVYSTYCAMHLRINRLLNLHQNNEYLKNLLISCNPYHQHSLSFESYLIKPVQRILKYPLFLQQMFIYCNINEHNQILSLKKSIKTMNKISKYINSMQKLYEDFGQSFEYFIQNSKEQSKKIFELNLPELYAYGEIDWINIYQFLSRKNYQDLKTYCFVFRNGCLLLVREESNKKNISDCFVRFFSMKELQVELLIDDNKHHSYAWQLIQINPKTQFKTYFRFANKDANKFVKTINNCILELSNSLKISSNQKHLLSSRSCHDLLPNGLLSNRNHSVNNRQSPSPIWKRRVTLLRKRPLSVPNNKKFK